MADHRHQGRHAVNPPRAGGVFMRKLVSIAVFAAVLVSLVWSGPPVIAQSKTIRIGYQPGPVLAWIVKEQQLLEKRGYKPEWTLFQHAAPELEAMPACSIDTGGMGTLSTLTGNGTTPGISDVSRAT